MATYYDAFIASVHRQCADVSVWCVSHAGHVMSPHGESNGQLNVCDRGSGIIAEETRGTCRGVLGGTDIGQNRTIYIYAVWQSAKLIFQM